MKKILIFSTIIFWTFSTLSCLAQNKPVTQKKQIVNTKWIYDFGDCKEFLEFGKKNTYKIYNCETGNTIYGKYHQQGNEVILEQFRSDFDRAFKEVRGSQTPHARFKLLINNDNMKYFVRWDIDQVGNWVISKYESEREYVFVKK